MEKNVNGNSANLSELVKNIVLGFCKINVTYAERLDVYGSVHIRADDCDVAHFVLNEHCYLSRASSPTVSSAQPSDHLTEGCEGDLHGGHRSLQKPTVKTEAPLGTEKDQKYATGLPSWQWSDSESTTMQHPQSSSMSQPGGAMFDSLTDKSGAVSQNSVSYAEGCVKRENLDSVAETHADDDELSNDGSIEILDSDPTEYSQYTDYGNDTAEVKPEFMKAEDDYDAEMPYGYDSYYDNYNNSNTSTYQFSNVSTSNYLNGQPIAARKFMKPGRPKSSPSAGQSMVRTSEKTCSFCQERFVSSAELAAHFQQYHQCTMPPSKKKRMTLSRKIDQMPNSIVDVNTEENVVKMYRCRFCDQLYRSQDGLQNHENVVHSRSKRYQCKFCSEEFLTRQAAYNHRVKFHRLLSRKMQ